MLIRNHKVVLVVHGEVLPVTGAFGVNLLCGFKIVCDIVVVAEHGLDLVSGAVKAIRNHKVLLVVHGERSAPNEYRYQSNEYRNNTLALTR